MTLKIVVLCLTFVVNLKAQNSKIADHLYATGNYTKAIELYKTLKEVEMVYDKIAKSYVAIGNYEEGLKYYKKAMTTIPDYDLLKYEYAKLLSRTKGFEQANTIFRNLIKSDSLNPNYHYELGVILEKQRDTTDQDEYRKTFDLDETHQKAIFKIAKHHLVKREFQIAHRFIDKGLESYADNVELINLKAQTYYHQENHAQAVFWFNRLLDLGENSDFIHEKLSLSYARNSEYEDAIYHRKQLLKHNPYDATSMYAIGTYYESLSDFEKAEDYITKSLLISDSSFLKEYQKLGRVLNRQKKYEKALKAYQKALKEDPSDIMTKFFIIRTKDEFYADLDAKIKLYEDFLKNEDKSPFKTYAERRLKDLKQEKFLKQD